ncbi:MAG: EscU/YscU/HrcU family type III secretion system export apparatus switch protein [Castellaniella sp.]|uniref:EscU/YscU/HrcU family type III secretion system export apparatus switch protein n=1 Tax=Castellaniella sp. TaxID=1955812 RepID=UPI002A369C55|nr:EscU/YscU/HrcU family type III secretion system export apparatus switch protein [Castellaniella sp.]MDY0309536.1 EscU/YscU/HrcU family type III secretion system export apparatus switch protein [Castellaniella sp.]
MKPPHPDPHRPSAVAVSYDPADSAPRVVAKGYGTLADTIVRTAREHGLYVHESPELVGLLMQVDLDAHIPPRLYVAIAELLAWLYALDTEGGVVRRPAEGEAPATPKAPGG